VRGTLGELVAHCTVKEPKGELVACAGDAE